jgi:hypothetical protein
VAELVRQYARTFAARDTRQYRAKLLTRLEGASDPRAERYWDLMAVINGWPTAPSLAPIFDWFKQALRHHSLDAPR